jgi:hypothetical protein
LHEELGKPIAIIFKNSIENKNIPNEWREGCITALFKKGSRKMASNYRPVRDRPFNLKGGYGFLFRSEFFFSDNTRIRIFIFFVAQSAKFYSRIPH